MTYRECPECERPGSLEYRERNSHAWWQCRDCGYKEVA